MIRKKAFWILCTILALAVGCSATRPTMLLDRDGENTVRFTDPETELKSEVRIAPDYAFLREASAEVKGVLLQGPLYAKGNDYILATAVSMDGYVRLGGDSLAPVDQAVRPLRAKMAFNARYCLLNYSRAAVMGDDVVGVVAIRDLGAGEVGNGTCPWGSLEEFEQARPGEAEAFQESAVQAAETSW
jgi:hypothetical protein